MAGAVGAMDGTFSSCGFNKGDVSVVKVASITPCSGSWGKNFSPHTTLSNVPAKKFHGGSGSFFFFPLQFACM